MSVAILERPLNSELISNAVFTNAITSVLTDPTTVTVTVNGPGGQTVYVYGTNSEIVKTATGVYVCRWLLNVAGRWFYYWRGTGDLVVSSFDRVINVPARKTHA